MKKFNKDLSGYTISFDNGGVPIFNDDLKNLELNTTISSVYSLFKGFNVVLSGCLITNINTTSKTCDMSAGLVLIDDIVYQVDALSNHTYPFSIINGSEVDDVRGFKNGNFNTVATTYNYSIRTNFVYGWSQDLYPNNISTSEIFFDPFTCQRAEYVLDALSKKAGDISLTTQTSSTTVTKDEQGNNIIGTLNYLNDISGTKFLKWKYFLYTPIESTGKLGFGYPQFESGSDSVILTANNLPAHNHNIGPNANVVADGQHDHQFDNAFYSETSFATGSIFGMQTSKLGLSLVNQIGNSGAVDYNNNPIAFKDLTENRGQHTHALSGRTENNTTTNTGIDIKGKTYGVKGFGFTGFPTVFIASEVSSPTGEIVLAYQWWKNNTIKYNNM